jgi:hypothetical protein
MPVSPNLIIAGVNKAGTTSLFTYMASHPDVTGSSVKETCYFLPVRYGKSVGSREEYYSLFDQGSSASVVMEATPGYFYGGADLAKEIDNCLPSARIVVVLRNPANRLISFFGFMKNMLLLDRSMPFSDYVCRCQDMTAADLRIESNNPYFGVEGGFYHKYLGGWQSQFGDRLRILFSEDLRNDPRNTMLELCQWLDIDNEHFNDFDFSIENKTSQFRREYLHRLALAVNKNFERVFRKYPSIKRGLRTFYSRLNLSNSNQAVSQSDRELATSLYIESNRKLKILLQQDTRILLPPWLRTA